MSLREQIEFHGRICHALRILEKSYPPFCDAMLDKLVQKAGVGYSCWDSEEYFEDNWRYQLDKHIQRIGKLDRFEDERENLVDIANIAMFGWWQIARVERRSGTIEAVRPALRGITGCPS